MEPKKPDENDKLAWLGAAMNQTHTDAITSVAAIFAAFYLKLTAEGVPDMSAAQLTEGYMLWLLERASEMGQS